MGYYRFMIFLTKGIFKSSYFCLRNSIIVTSLKNILSNFFVLITLLSFVISTTGFTSYSHDCMHHEAQKNLLSTDDDCCTSVIIESDKEDCCQPSSCNTEEDHATCCTVELSYYRLSEWFTSNDSQKRQAVCEQLIFKIPCVNSTEINELVKDQGLIDKEDDPVPKIPIYRLYSQTKIDPPLINSCF